jgi:hypothetical protein
MPVRLSESPPVLLDCRRCQTLPLLAKDTHHRHAHLIRCHLIIMRSSDPRHVCTANWYLHNIVQLTSHMEGPLVLQALKCCTVTPTLQCTVL